MPKGRSTRRSSSKRSSTLKSRSISPVLKPRFSVFQQSMTYTSNPAPGTPYGRVVTLAINNGKKTKSVSNLNKNGQVMKKTPRPSV